MYQSASIFAGGRPHIMPLTEENRFVPDLDAIPEEILKETSLLFVNYPNNPTGAVADLAFYERCVALARQYDFVICSDAAYCEMSFEDGDRPHSVLEVPGAGEVAVELRSLSKTFNMTGWRLGFAVGNPEVLAALAKIKGNMDSGQFNAIQQAGVTALRNIDGPEIAGIRDLYRQRRDLLVPGLNRLGFEVRTPRATFYVWARCPNGLDSMTCAARMLDDAAIVAVPGVGFGAPGEGYVRFALTIESERVTEALDRLGGLQW